LSALILTTMIVAASQVMVVTISESVIDYARDVRRVLRREKFRVDVDDSSSTVNRKVREAQLSKYNYILVRPCRSHRKHCHTLCLTYSVACGAHGILSG
jgi:Leu/Phe-tRNA-protein transferase